MNYIYDILLNFNRQLYDFFEWELNDSIIHIRKIPLYRIDSKALLNIRNHKVKVALPFLEKIRNKTEVFTNKSVDTIEYSTLLTDGSSVLAVQFSPDGSSYLKSSLLIDEDVEVLDVSNRLREVELAYEILKNESYNPLKSRKAQIMERFVKEELKKSKKQHDYEKLSYLYFDCFGETENSIGKILNYFYEVIKKGDYNIVHKLYDFFKLTSVSK